MDEWDSTPRIAFLSPEPGSGKTRALEVSETLVPRPVEAVNTTPAYLFRKVSDPDGLPTILFDEIDTIFGPRAKDNEEIRGMLNAGHRRGAMAGRCVVRGAVVTTEELPAYCAVAMAGLGDLPDTILTRSVIINMRRRAPNEVVEPYRRRIHAPVGYELRSRIARWAEHFELVEFPDMPEVVVDRPADVWEPLIAIADAAGEPWSTRGRVAAVALVAQVSEREASLGVRLLADIRKIFGDSDHLPTDTILQRLCDLDEAPWAELRGKPINSRSLANFLKRYSIKSKTIRVGTSTPKGYDIQDFHDSWARYLPPSDSSATSATYATNGSGLTETCPKCDGEGCGYCDKPVTTGQLGLSA
jgi:hypothetical protein